MKKILIPIALTLLFACLFQIIKASPLTDSTKNTAFNYTEERSVSGFSGISSSGSFTVMVTMGDKESLRLEGDSTILNKIETKVEDGILKIKDKNSFKLGSWTWHDSHDAKANKTAKVMIYIAAKNLNELIKHGSGNMKVEGALKAERLTTTVSGSGNISFNADVTDYTGTISGSGRIHCSGNTKNANIVISGSGEFKGKGFHSANTNVKISGSGSASIYADNTLNAAISGSGSVIYSGNAEVSKTKSGSGNIFKIKQ